MDGLGKSISDLLYASLVGIAIYVSGEGIWPAIIFASLAYTIVQALRTPDMWQTLQRREEEKTRRFEVKTTRREPAGGLHAITVLPKTKTMNLPRNWVPATPQLSDGIRQEAISWLSGLWVDNETFDTSRVLPVGSKAPGKIQKGHPRREVLEALMDKNLVMQTEKGLTYCGPPTLRMAAMRLGRAGG